MLPLFSRDISPIQKLELFGSTSLAAGKGTNMRINRFSVVVLSLVTALSFPLVGCKGSSNSASSKGEATKTTEAAKPKEPETRVNNTTDADVEFVSLDKDGITLKL